VADSKFLIEVEEDGTISMAAGEIAPTSHRQADDILRDHKVIQGGANKETRTPHSHGTAKQGVKVGR